MEHSSLKADTSKILMSDALKDKISNFDDDVEKLDMLSIYVIVERVQQAEGTQDEAPKPFSGILRGISIDQYKDIEIEMRIPLDEAIQIVKDESVKVVGLELQQGDDTLKYFKETYLSKAIRVDEIDIVNQLCVLGMHLHRVKCLLTSYLL